MSTPRTDQLNTGLLSACKESVIYDFMLNHARSLERELQQMNKQIVQKLVKYIDARIAEIQASQSSDGGFLEAYLAARLKDELLEGVEDE